MVFCYGILSSLTQLFFSPCTLLFEGLKSSLGVGENECNTEVTSSRAARILILTGLVLDFGKNVIGRRTQVSEEVLIHSLSQGAQFDFSTFY